MPTRTPSIRSLAPLAALLAALLAACTGDTAAAPPDPNADASTSDAGADGAAPPGDRGPVEEGACASDQDCADTSYCNGSEHCVMGRCAAGTNPCDDRYSCTRDRCDEGTRSCAHDPDDSVCGDHDACNGVERCDPTTPGAIAGSGCQPVHVDDQIDCDDRNTCTLDTCDATLGCVHAARDLDGDGFVDRACTLDGTPHGTQGTDCNDSDPRVFPGAPEICDDGRDNNCNLLVDYADTAFCTPTNDACDRAQEIRLAGEATYNVVGSTVGIAGTLATTCGQPGRATALYRFTLASPEDISINDDDTAGAGASIALLSTCAAGSELRCARGLSAAAPQVQIRSVPAGTYFIAVQTSVARIFHLHLTVGHPTTSPANDVCPTAGSTPPVDLGDGLPHVVSFAGLLPDYSMSCDTGAPTPDAVYPLTLTAPRNVTLTGVSAAGERVTMALYRDPCAVATGEIRCAAAVTTSRILQRPLAAGRYYVVVRTGSAQSVTLQATLSDPTMRAPGDACPGLVVTPDGPPLTVTMTGLDSYPDVGTSCGSNGTADGWTDAVASFTLTTPRDVNIAIGASGFASLRLQLQTDCMARTSVVGPCVTGAPPVRRYRGLGAGTYYVIVESNAPPPSFSLTVTTTAPGVRLPGDTCPGVDVVPDGAPGVINPAGFDVTSDIGTSCGSVRPTDNWTDWVFHFALATPRDVDLTMLGGSAMRMQLGSSCGVGAPSIGGCLSGTTTIERRYRSLPAGDYYVVGEQAGTSGLAGPLRLIVATSDPGVRAVGDTCGTAAVLTPDGAPTVLPIGGFDPVPDHGTPCGSAMISAPSWTDLAGTFTLAAPRDVTVSISGTPITQFFAVLEHTCGVATTALGSCLSGPTGSWIQRYPSLPAGTYSIVAETRSVAASSTATVSVTTLPPGTTPTYRRVDSPADLAWFEACSAPGVRRVLPGQDDSQTVDPLPFTFRYWGVPVTMAANISTNGFISLDGAPSASLGGAIPDRSAPNAVIAALWLDLVTGTGGICLATTGTAPNRRYVAQWDHATYYANRAADLSFEIALDEGTNAIDVVYQTLSAPPASGTIGVENLDGSDGVVLCSGSTSCAVMTGTRYRWVPTP